MRLLADENVHPLMVARLRADGHVVEFIREISPGETDPGVLAASVGFDAVLVTHDKDFGELVYRHNQRHVGVVLVRLSALSVEVRADTVSALIAARGQALVGMFTVLAPGKVRTSRPA